MKIIEQDEDISLVEKIKLNNDEESLKYLIKKHDPMCFSLYKKYSNLINASPPVWTDLINLLNCSLCPLSSAVFKFEKPLNINYKKFYIIEITN